MKAGLAAMIAATAAFTARRTVAVAQRSPSTASAARKTAGRRVRDPARGHRADACVIAEPTSGDLDAAERRRR